MKFQRIQTVRCLDNDNDGVIYLMERGLDAILLLVDQQGGVLYSLRSEFTGLYSAALRVCTLTVSSATISRGGEWRDESWS